MPYVRAFSSEPGILLSRRVIGLIFENIESVPGPLNHCANPKSNFWGDLKGSTRIQRETEASMKELASFHAVRHLWRSLLRILHKIEFEALFGGDINAYISSNCYRIKTCRRLLRMKHVQFVTATNVMTALH